MQAEQQQQQQQPRPQPRPRPRPQRSRSRWQLTMELAEEEAKARKLEKQQNQFGESTRESSGGGVDDGSNHNNNHSTHSSSSSSGNSSEMRTNILLQQVAGVTLPLSVSLLLSNSNRDSDNPATSRTTSVVLSNGDHGPIRSNTPTTEENTDDDDDDEEEEESSSNSVDSSSHSMTTSIENETQKEQGKKEEERGQQILEEEKEDLGQHSLEREEDTQGEMKDLENMTLQSSPTHGGNDDDCKGSPITIDSSPAPAPVSTTGVTAAVSQDAAGLTAVAVDGDGDGDSDAVDEVVEEEQQQQPEEIDDGNDYSDFVHSFLMSNRQHPEEEIVYSTDDEDIINNPSELLGEQDNNVADNNMKSPKSKTKKKYPTIELTSPSTPKTPKKMTGKKVFDKDIMKTPKSKTKTKKKSNKKKTDIVEAAGSATAEMMEMMETSDGDHNGERIVEIQDETLQSPTTNSKMKRSPKVTTKVKSPRKTLRSLKKALTPKRKHKNRLTTTTTMAEPTPVVETKVDIESVVPAPADVSCYSSLTTTNERETEPEHASMVVNNDTIHSGDTSTAGEASFHDDDDDGDDSANSGNDDGIDNIIVKVNEEEEKEGKEKKVRKKAELQADVESSPRSSPVVPLRRHNSLPMHRQQSSRALPLGIETIHEVHDEVDMSPVKATHSSMSLTSLTQHNDKGSTIVSPAPRLSMDELRASLHMAAKEAADVGNHTKLSERVVEAVASDDSSSFDSDDDDDDWDGFGDGADDFELDSEFDEFSIQVESRDLDTNNPKSSSTVEEPSDIKERGEDLKSPMRQSTHQRRQQHKNKDADEWKLKHGLAVENDLSRSNHFRIINEAAALGSMKRLKAISTEWKDKTDVEDTSKTHTDDDDDDDDDKGDGKIPVFLKRRRKLLLKTSDRMDKFLEDAKLEKKKTMYAPEHVIERLHEYEEISERFAGGDYGFLPATEPPSFQKPKVWIGQNRIRSTIVQDAVKEAENRNQRLTTSFHLQVRKKCPCKYCKSPTPFQTVAYQEIKQEQRQKQKLSEKKVAPKSPKRRPDDLSNTIHSSHPAGPTVNVSAQSPYSRTLLRSTSQVFKKGVIQNTVTMKELKSPVWASPTLKKTVKIEKCDVSRKPIWAEVTGKRDDSLPEWASDDLRKMIEKENKQKLQGVKQLEDVAVGSNGGGSEDNDGDDHCHDESKGDDANPAVVDEAVAETIVSSTLSNEEQQHQQEQGFELELEPQQRKAKGEHSRKAIKSERRAKKWKSTRKGKAYRDKKEKKKATRSGSALAATKGRGTDTRRTGVEER